jgi:hypothetical protein
MTEHQRFLLTGTVIKKLPAFEAQKVEKELFARLTLKFSHR